MQQEDIGHCICHGGSMMTQITPERRTHQINRDTAEEIFRAIGFSFGNGKLR